jgi:ATP-binding cassette subfamily B protein RtxB
MNRLLREQERVISALKCCKILFEISSGKTPPDYEVSGNNLKSAVNTYSKVTGINFSQKRLALKKVTPEQLPAAFSDKQSGYFILARLSSAQALIQSPDVSLPEVISVQELENRWGGQVILLKASAHRFNIKWFIPAFLRHREILGNILVFSLVLQLLALITPLFFQVVMDKVLVHNALATLDVLVIVLVIVGIFEVVLHGLREYLLAHTANRVDVILGVKLFRHLLGLPLLYFKNRQVGAIISRVQELHGIREFLTSSMLVLGIDIVFMVVFLGVMAFLSWSLTLIVLGTLPCYFLLAWRSTKSLQKRIERQFQTSAVNTSFLNESVGGIETIKSLAVEPRMQRRWERQTTGMVTAGFQTQIVNALVSHSVMLLQKITAVIVIWAGAQQVITLGLTIGQLIAFNMMLSHINQPISKLIDLWQKFIQTRVAVNNLGEMLNLPVEQEQEQEYQMLTSPINGELHIVNLMFRYQPDHEPIIKRINLHIAAGESLGIVGPSGSGKSTLAKLLQKLYVPDEGEIFLDKIPLSQLDPFYLRNQIGVVLQENYLFNRSVRHNIAFKDPTASLDDVVAVARLAGAHDFFLALPRGYDTILSEGGTSLSGGQRQRIAIARALMGAPRLLIFDEATSALDDESQEIIQRNMAEIARGRTVIIIAHRLSTVRHCDRIITIEQGEITESGSHQQLLSAQGCYARLWALQQELQQEK